MTGVDRDQLAEFLRCRRGALQPQDVELPNCPRRRTSGLRREEVAAPDSVEVGAYSVVAEALTNAAKHARASVVEVGAHATGTTLRLVIRDHGVGGGAAGKGSGLTGLVDSVEALGGKMTIQKSARQRNLAARQHPH
jgi:glucose-6-phosphate-specific signal transduction histidine kinase